jgi:hypothetical protein
VACMTSRGQEIDDFGQTGVCMTLQIWFVIFKMIALEKIARWELGCIKTLATCCLYLLLVDLEGGGCHGLSPFFKGHCLQAVVDY